MGWIRAGTIWASIFYRMDLDPDPVLAQNLFPGSKYSSEDRDPDPELVLVPKPFLVPNPVLGPFRSRFWVFPSFFFHYYYFLNGMFCQCTLHGTKWIMALHQFSDLTFHMKKKSAIYLSNLWERSLYTNIFIVQIQRLPWSNTTITGISRFVCYDYPNLLVVDSILLIVISK